MPRARLGDGPPRAVTRCERAPCPCCSSLFFQCTKASLKRQAKVLTEQLVVIRDEVVSKSERSLASRLDLLECCPVIIVGISKMQPNDVYVWPGYLR